MPDYKLKLVLLLFDIYCEFYITYNTSEIFYLELGITRKTKYKNILLTTVLFKLKRNELFFTIHF